MSEKTVNAKAALETYANEINGWMASQLDACTRCGLCAEACHFYVSTGNPNYTPIWKAELLRRVYQQKFTPAGRLASALGLVRPITEENLREWVEYDYFACTMCNRCSQVCPMGIDIASLIHVAREGLAAAGLVPEDLMQATNRQVEEGSPLGVTDDVFEERLELFEDFLEDADYEGDIPIDKQ
ncbi:MAG: (Fe-S)-binding protein, partial [Chloroflexi bacterium]|nr:(Fe-S)-binding protein [Chloroflexota bacterium]